MNRIVIIIISIVLFGCDSGGSSGGNSSSGGLASSLASGFAAGAGAAAGHQAINHGIEKFKNYKRAKQIRHVRSTQRFFKK